MAVAPMMWRSKASERRRNFRHALGSFLDLVVISLAGGGGVESALTDASEIGRGWAFFAGAITLSSLHFFLILCQGRSRLPRPVSSRQSTVGSNRIILRTADCILRFSGLPVSFRKAFLFGG